MTIRPQITRPIPPTSAGHNAVVLQIVSDCTVQVYYAWIDRTGVVTTDPGTFLVIDTDTCTVWRNGARRPTIRFPHALLHPDGSANYRKVRAFVKKVIDL